MEERTSFKREVSVSIADLRDGVKRMAMEDGNEIEQKINGIKEDGLRIETNNNPIVTVFSSSEDGFEAKYEILNEIGRGGFSVVYRCRERSTGTDYAVKIIDLRPLRLRERFNPLRLRREVDIIRRLKHRNIIHFIAVYETDDQLLMVSF